MAVIQQYALLIENECGERVERERERLHSPIEIEGVAKGFLELDFTAEEPF